VAAIGHQIGVALLFFPPLSSFTTKPGFQYTFAGQFFSPLDFEVFDLHPGSDPTKTDATMVVKNRQLTVTR
jgi:hypothetical protein